MKLQQWFCDKCGSAGSVEVRPHAGVWEVATKIRDAHTKATPECCYDPRVLVAGDSKEK